MSQWKSANFFRRKLSETNQIAWMQNFARNNVAVEIRLKEAVWNYI